MKNSSASGRERAGAGAPDEFAAGGRGLGLAGLCFDLIDALDEQQGGQRDFGRMTFGFDKLAPDVGEATAEKDGFESCGEREVGAVAVALDGTFVAEGVGQRIVAEKIQQTVMPASGVPVVITGASQRIVVDPEVAGLGGAVAGFEILDGRFIDLEFGGFEHLGLDGLVDGFQVAGGGVGPGVEGLPPDVRFMSSSETLGLAVVREVVRELVGDDLCGERGGAKGAGDAGKRGWSDDGRTGLVGLVLELLADSAPPDHLGLDDVEFVVMLFADFLEVIGVGFDFVGDDHVFDDHLEVRLWSRFLQ